MKRVRNTTIGNAIDTSIENSIIIKIYCLMYKLFKYILVFIITILYLHNLFAQALTLSTDLTWKEKDLYFLNYDKVNVPVIKFNYKNDTADSIYFYNPLQEAYASAYLNFNHYPEFLVNEDILDKWEALISSFPNWRDNEYIVTLTKSNQRQQNKSFLLHKKDKANINSDEIEKSHEHEILETLTSLLIMQSELDKNNTNLQYKYFHNPEKITSMKKISDYYTSIISLNTDSLICKPDEYIYDNCIFLKPYEEISFEYDLTPFFLLKGSYNFIIEPQMSDSILFSNNYMFVFPRIYNGYELYTGKVDGINMMMNITQ